MTTITANAQRVLQALKSTKGKGIPSRLTDMFTDVPAGVEELRAAGYRITASNGGLTLPQGTDESAWKGQLRYALAQS